MQKITPNNHPHIHSQPVIIGIGFSKKISALEIIKNLNTVLQPLQYHATDISLPAFKQDDLNVLELKALATIPIHLIPQETLIALQPQCSSFSEHTYHHTGLGAVAEACALAIIHKNGRLLIPKMIYNGINFSIAIKGDSL